MNYKYYNDAMKNYLVVDCGDVPEEAAEPCDEHEKRQSGYQYQMISVNRIPGLVSCSLRLINQRQYLYYDITSLQNLGRMLQDRGQMEVSDRKLLYSLADTGEVIAKYLLDSRKILLDPEFIYYDGHRDEYLFLYYPEETGSYATLLDCLSSAVRPEDKRNAGAVYQLREMAQNPNFILTSTVLDGVYGSAQRYPEQRESQMERGQSDPDAGWQNKQNGFRCGNAAVLPRQEMEGGPGGWDNRREEFPYSVGSREPSDRGGWDSGNWEGGPQKQAYSGRNTTAAPSSRTESTDGKENDTAGTQNRPGHLLLWAVLFLGIACGAEILHVRVPLAAQYDLVCRAAAAAGICISVLLAFYGVFLSLRGRRAAQAEDAGSVGPVMEQTLDFRKRELEAGIRRGNAAIREEYTGPGENGSRNYAAAQTAVFWDTDRRQSSGAGMEGENLTQHKLYGEDEYRSCRIDLRHLPCMVGRDAGTCSVQLNDPSVSPTHVRFSQGGTDRVVMTDLGSTQGTYLNGCRLRAEESREIMPGDEVRIGRYVFCYR